MLRRGGGFSAVELADVTAASRLRSCAFSSCKASISRCSSQLPLGLKLNLIQTAKCFRQDDLRIAQRICFWTCSCPLPLAARLASFDLFRKSCHGIPPLLRLLRCLLAEQLLLTLLPM